MIRPEPVELIGEIPVAGESVDEAAQFRLPIVVAAVDGDPLGFGLFLVVEGRVGRYQERQTGGGVAPRVTALVGPTGHRPIGAAAVPCSSASLARM